MCLHFSQGSHADSGYRAVLRTVDKVTFLCVTAPPNHPQLLRVFAMRARSSRAMLIYKARGFFPFSVISSQFELKSGQMMK